MSAESSRLQGVSLYAPDEASAVPCDLDLSDNTNLWGMPPAAQAAIAEAAARATRYPTTYGGGALKDALARYLDVEPSMIVTGCGSDDVLDSAMRALAEPGDAIAFPSPTFSMIPVFAAVSGLIAAPIEMREDYSIDVDALLAARARLTYLCSPNNPTSTEIARADIERVVDEAEGIVIVDEAYAEFAGVSGVELLARSDRLLVTRTMSKAFGLAGLRIGYGAASPAIIAAIEKARGPYTVNALAERAAVAAMSEQAGGLSWVREHVREATEMRDRVAEALRQRGFVVARSAANFLFVPNVQARVIGEQLRVRGIAVRVLTALPVFGDALRITVGPWEMMQRLLDAMDAA